MNVSISPGLRLDDATAKRFVQGMLNDLAGHAWKTVRNEPIWASLGNPKGQQRAFRRLCRDPNTLILHAALIDSRSRCRFRMYFIVWNVLKHKQTGGLRLGIDMHIIRGDGPGTVREEDRPVITFSEHALQRLVQRSGISSGQDYLPLLRSMTTSALRLAIALGTAKPEDGEAWPLPVSLPNGEKAVL